LPTQAVPPRGRTARRIPPSPAGRLLLIARSGSRHRAWRHHEATSGTPAGRSCAASFRKGGGLVDAPGRWLVGTKGESPHCPVYLLASVKQEPTWQEIKVEDAKTGTLGWTDYHLSLVYKPTPTIPAFPIVEGDTTAIARALLQTLVAAGYTSKDIHIAVFAHVPTRKGETGQQLVLPLGWTRYESTSDSLKSKNPTGRTSCRSRSRRVHSCRSVTRPDELAAC
jgi:hypothetical protein